MNIKSRCYMVSLIICLVSFFVINPNNEIFAIPTNTSLKMICKTDDATLSGMDWNLYKVSSSKKDDNFILEGDFANYKVSLKDLSTTSNMLDVANTLENYAILDKITPTNYGTTNDDGIVSFADLEVGLYLLSGKSVIIGDKKYTPSAMLIEMEENKETSFVLTAYPKFNVKTVSNKEVKYSVKKMWLNDDNNLEQRPNDIIIELYKDEELYTSVHLNDDNNWEYSWTSTDVSDWRVKEVSVPENYVVIYKNNEVEYLVVNIRSTDDDDKHNQTNSNSLSSSVTTSVSASNITKITTSTTSSVSSSTNLVSNTNVTKDTTSSNSGTSTNTDITTTTIDTNISTSNNSSTSNTNVSNNGNSNNTANATSNSKSNGTTISSDSSKLPQTGQNWFPVPILILSGTILIAIGLQLNSKK